MQAQVVPASKDGIAETAATGEGWSLRPVPAAAGVPDGEAGQAVRGRRVRSPGLQARIILLMVASLALLALVTAFATSALLEGQMLDGARSKGVAIATGLLRSAALLQAAGQPLSDRALLEAFEELDGVAYLVFYDRSGRPVASTFASLPATFASPPTETSGEAASLVMMPPAGQAGSLTALDVAVTGSAGMARVGMDRDALLTRVRGLAST